jgi:hypothetical protein
VLSVVDCDVDHASGVAFNMLFVCWRRRTLEQAFRRCIVSAIALGRRYPEGIGVSHYLDVDSQPPDSDVRTAFVDILRVGCIRHYSVTYDATGFRAAAIRGVISATTRLGRPKFAHAVHVTQTAAAEWHAQQQAALGRPETSGQIERAALELRRIHGDRFPTTVEEHAVPKSSRRGHASG